MRVALEIEEDAHLCGRYDRRTEHIQALISYRERLKRMISAYFASFWRFSFAPWPKGIGELGQRQDTSPTVAPDVLLADPTQEA